ncbi:toxin-antitoxin system HicB family antitoxin [Acinetobacter guerrae]|uniref:Toxin-antitoxin system HicB family antitoxin n=1 Tax=Acinetobacter guerrae TaxID=1843371 RepID=A0A3A8EWX0_9GAMM|nr:toxin-antitoxin system HicB family antitoxin [Acinetobacter guerrae]RKG35190.1 toxin-antitoxin system HicB family antitoxin [Acinetobacter guerrae]
MKENRKKSVDVRVRVSIDLHERLKAKSKNDERSMNYLTNKAIELFLEQKGAKA